MATRGTMTEMEPMPAGVPGPSGAERRVRREHGISAVQQVYDGMREEMINLVLVPGSTVAKNEIASRFGVSQTPVRPVPQARSTTTCAWASTSRTRSTRNTGSLSAATFSGAAPWGT